MKGYLLLNVKMWRCITLNIIMHGVPSNELYMVEDPKSASEHEVTLFESLKLFKNTIMKKKLKRLEELENNNL
jgi:hypothetical protein